MRKLFVSSTLVLMLTVAASLHGQQVDAALGFGTVTAPPAGNGLPSQSGGLYISFSGNFLLWMHNHLGAGFNISPRLRQAPYTLSFTTIGYRPIFYDFNAVYGGTWLKKKVGADVMAGIGAQSNHFYTGGSCGVVTCSNYQSATHFAWHVGADVRYYVYGHVFIRPEAHYYIIHNSGDFQGIPLFNNGNAARYAVSIGYSFTPGF